MWVDVLDEATGVSPAEVAAAATAALAHSRRDWEVECGVFGRPASPSAYSLVEDWGPAAWEEELDDEA